MTDQDPNEIVYIQHPGIEVLGSCTRQAAEEVWAEKGWKVVDDPTTSEEYADFNPADHTVPEVKSHLASLAADDPERQRIIDAEAGGKARNVS